ncbi:adenosylcobinamide-GDP ribazoletransferase [Paenibacillus sp. ACRRX]|uniref:adenosylcobinamide-GDP ribazoletransferase n=1 Tax=Paenibacillus sp. ACRRX TaxID=2918206 RepID=UPI001EF570CB|nr:adenosylcobinamide-GDP ribazoletransferase [Paenibacillus sp. ACRRX]MCG7409974.1 adenosylcobinamide-GDP ribazoletransferase [Paenibacillus sp. ACRRX]
MKLWLQALVAAVQFLTRIPFPVEVPFTNQVLKRSVVFFPLAGGLVGILVWLAGAGLTAVLPPWPAAALVLLIALGLTGGLHLDGLMDTADGILSHRPRERMLEIMKDSRVGAMGVIVCFIVLLVQWSLFAVMMEHGQWGLFIALPFIGSRYAMVWAIASEPCARKESGLGVMFHGVHMFYVLGTMLTTIALSALFLFGGLNLPAPFAAGGMEQAWRWSPILLLGGYILIVQIFSWACSRSISRKLGGLTGDTYGAICEIMLTLLLLGLVINLGLDGGGGR